MKHSVSILATTIVCLYLVGCDSSSNSNELQNDGQNIEPGVDSVDIANFNYTLQIDENVGTSVVPGEIVVVPILTTYGDSTVSSLSLSGAPDWASIDDELNLKLSPPASTTGGVTLPFTISYSISNTDGISFSETLDYSLYIALETILLSGLMPASGGVISTEWNDVLIRSNGDLESDYTLSFSLVESGPSEYAFKFDSLPEISESDRGKITLDHAPLTELYVNFRNSDAFSDGEVRSSADRNIQSRSRVNSLSQFNVPAVCSNLRYNNSVKYPDDYLMSNVWSGTEGVFVSNVSFDESRFENGGEPRVLPTFEPLVTQGLLSHYDDIDVKIQCATALQSTISSTDVANYQGREPVLFVHGFDPSGALGGRDDYFGRLTGMIQELELDAERRFFPLTFRWQTNARFELVAEELATAIEQINTATGKKVHIVSHSFGGVLVRTMLQGLSLDVQDSTSSIQRFENMIASVTTVGSPHSGVYGSTSEYTSGDQSWTFNRGFSDNHAGVVSSTLCGSINCHQLGKEYSPSLGLFEGSEFQEQTMKQYIGLADQPVGKLAFDLASTYPASYPMISTNVLIGAESSKENPGGLLDDLILPDRYRTASHDGLISSYGQLWKSQTLRALESNIEGKPVFEYYLGHTEVTSNSSEANSFEAGQFNSQFQHDFWITSDEDYQFGYTHSSKNSGGLNLTEVGFELCKADEPENCTHAAWHYITDLLNNTGEQIIEPEQGETIVVAGRVEVGGFPAANVFVSISYPNGQGLSTQTNESGGFSESLPFFPNSRITIFADPTRSTNSSPAPGLRAEMRSFDTVATSDESQGNVGVIRLQAPDRVDGSLSLDLSDSSNGLPLSQFSYTVFNSGGVQVASGESNDVFLVELTLPYDTYNVEATVEGYSDVSGFICEHFSEQTQCSLATDPAGFVAVGGMSTVLSWGQNPRDLDSHLIKLTGDNTEYHVYYSDPNASNASLDVDDRSSFGPETITVQTLETGADDRYVYAVRHYTGSGSITSTSNAQVRVSIGGQSPRVFTPPSNELSADDDYWKVFEIRGGRLLPCSQGCIFNSIAAMVSTAVSSDGRSLEPSNLLARSIGDLEDSDTKQ
ncbi:alpha/beta hydrolase [Granulosicoccus antarcticus]|uniref:Uncharacterized protein n=1 Tax=Granulosicoccus antarcticus IMCC3135 TaxID=1192854 RepID=A0A2Z2NGA9_9GAMM|nr:alpha/beta hydrolase [Granulosicoccus antarcticus]ASJ70316.1 hypothetical protein IMCC3135_00950 [Granulosicoccus antarcticus IMCC3135]